jgi:hypothetical protein
MTPKINPRGHCDMNLSEELLAKCYGIIGVLRDITPEIEGTIGFGIDLKVRTECLIEIVSACLKILSGLCQMVIIKGC